MVEGDSVTDDDLHAELRHLRTDLHRSQENVADLRQRLAYAPGGDPDTLLSMSANQAHRPLDVRIPNRHQTSSTSISKRCTILAFPSRR